MTKKPSPVVDYLVYVLIRLLICLAQAITWDAALNLARALAWIAYRLDRRHRLVAHENLRHAFGDLDERARDRLVRASYLHLMTMVVEMTRVPRVLHPHNADRYVQLSDSDLEHFQRLKASGRKCLVVTGHFGNWEILNFIAGLSGFRGGIVARRLDNPYLDHFLARFRRQTGQVLLDKSADYQRILKFLDRGISLGMVGDQDAGPRGLFVEFFGRPASTFKSIALLSLEYQAAIVVTAAARVGQPMRYRVYLEDVILPEQYTGDADPARAITQRYTNALQRMVLRHPEQYFWLHGRWKNQPQPRVMRRAA